MSIEAADGTADVPHPGRLRQSPSGSTVSLTGSHIRPQPGFGYDERRHVTVWGTAAARGDGRLVAPRRSGLGLGRGRDPVPRVRRAHRAASRTPTTTASPTEQGRVVQPRLSRGWLTLRATRLPFLSATLIPVGVGIAIAAAQGFFDLFTALVTLIGAAAVHLGLNVANDVFDARLGADDANVRPTQFSGGSRVIQYGLVSLRRMSIISALDVRHRHRPAGSSCSRCEPVHGAARHRRPRDRPARSATRRRR